LMVWHAAHEAKRLAPVERFAVERLTWGCRAWPGRASLTHAADLERLGGIEARRLAGCLDARGVVGGHAAGDHPEVDGSPARPPTRLGAAVVPFRLVCRGSWRSSGEEGLAGGM